jgi:hypothetical protein
VLTPYKGTPLYDKLEQEGRLLAERGMEFYNGYNVTFIPRNMTPEALVQAHRKLWRTAFSLTHSLGRILRGLFCLRPGAALMSIAMNGFYCLKNLRRNRPIDMSRSAPDGAHDSRDALHRQGLSHPRIAEAAGERR